MACLSLGQFLNDRLDLLRLVEGRADLVRRHEVRFGEGYLETLRRRGASALSHDVQALFERAAQFDDVILPSGGTVADRAASALNGLRRLTIGELAPDTQGVDQHGAPLQLSDFLGHVVLLYFWVEI